MVASFINVLVVEDVELSQKAVTYILSKLNCHVTIAATGQEALSYGIHVPYHLIFMDIGLPDRDGITVTETLRHTSLANQQTPIIALTAHAPDEALVQRCSEAGMNDFLTKPLVSFLAHAILAKYTRQNFKAAQPISFYDAQHY